MYINTYIVRVWLDLVYAETNNTMIILNKGRCSIMSANETTLRPSHDL